MIKKPWEIKKVETTEQVNNQETKTEESKSISKTDVSQKGNKDTNVSKPSNLKNFEENKKNLYTV